MSALDLLQAGLDLLRKEQPSPDAMHVDGYGSEQDKKPKKGKKKMPAETEKSEFEQTVRIWKAEAGDEQLVYGVVLEPDLRDSQGDIVGADEIRKAAHDWLLNSRLSDDQHNEKVVKAGPVESFIAPCDMELEGEQVTKGSWVLVTKVEDPQIWQEIKDGAKTGYSIGGSAIRLAEDGD